MSDPNHQPPEHACEYLLRTCAANPTPNNRALVLGCLTAWYNFDETYTQNQYNLWYANTWNVVAEPWKHKEKTQPFKYTNVRKFTYEFCDRELLIKIKTARGRAHVILTEHE